MPAPTDAKRIRDTGICDLHTAATLPPDSQAFLARPVGQKDVLLTLAEARTVFGDGTLLNGNFNPAGGVLPQAKLNDWLRVGIGGTIGGQVYMPGEWWQANQVSPGGVFPTHWTRRRLAGDEGCQLVYSSAHGLTSASDGKQIGWNSLGKPVVVTNANEADVQNVASLAGVIDVDNILICSSFQVTEIANALLPVDKLVFGLEDNDRIYAWKTLTSTYDHSGVDEAQIVYYIGPSPPSRVGFHILLSINASGFVSSVPGGGGSGPFAPQVHTGVGPITLTNPPTTDGNILITRVNHVGVLRGAAYPPAHYTQVSATVTWIDTENPLISTDVLIIITW